MSYVYPFGPKAVTERIDMGQDFGGAGSILAIGNARVLRVNNTGWTQGGGAGVLYQLLDGPMAGRRIYVNEGITPTVHNQQLVKAGQVIGKLIPGSSTGVEIGFANASGQPVNASTYKEGQQTVGGKEMASFLTMLKGGTGSGGVDIAGIGKTALGLGLGVTPAGLALDAGSAVGNLAGKADSAAAGAASSLAKEVVNQIAKLLGINATAIMLNIGLVGGGGVLFFYGVAKMFGVSKPIATPTKAIATMAVKAPE